MKKTVTVIMALILLISIFSIANASFDLRRPYDNYYSSQNPPDFSWNYASNATYSLIIATDKEMKNIVYQVDNLRKNVYNFSEPFEPGEYYWTYRVNGGKNVEVRRFYIPENAKEFTVPFNYDNNSQMEIVIIKNLPPHHPRILINDDSLSKLKENKQASASLRDVVEANMIEGIPEAPEAIGDLDDLLGLEQSVKSKWFSYYSSAPLRATNAALLYLATDETKYRDYAINVLASLCAKDSSGNYLWNPSKLFPWYSTTDTYEGAFAYHLGLAYDWMYNDLSDQIKTDIIKVIELNIKRPYENHGNGGILSGSLYTNPMGSHQYELNRSAVAALAIYEESQLARDLANFHIPVMINITTPHSYQDGGFGQGLFYGIDTNLSDTLDSINELNIVNIKNKAYSKNKDYFYPYFWSFDQCSVFGDGGGSLSTKTFQYPVDVQNKAAKSDNEVMRSVNKWLLHKVNDNKNYYYKQFFSTYINSGEILDVTAKEPFMLPLSKAIFDVGYASVNSSLSDDNRVAMRFKSSPYGSYNHSHPDQNSFVIDAFGENLLIDSNYYNLMGSDFDIAYNRKTWVHNGITYDGGKGQSKMNSNADGEITDFLYFPEFDVIKASAKDAYNIDDSNQAVTAMDKADRTIIYLRPETFIIIDDLKSASGEKSFEFWLNTKGTITTDSVNPNKATINQNDAYAFAEVLYPAVTNKVYAFNENPDGTFISQSVLENQNKNLVDSNGNILVDDKRIAFKTEKTAGTKMITVISVNNEAQPDLDITYEEIDGVIKIYAGYNTIYINNTGNPVAEADGIIFTGEALVSTNSGSYGIINGTKLEAYGYSYIESDAPVTAGFGNGKVTISSVKSDAEVKIYTGPINQIHKTEDEKEYKLTEGVRNYGIKYVNDGEYTTFNVYPSHYILNLDDSLHEGYTTLTVTKEGNGEIVYDGIDRVMLQSQKTFKVIPESGYYVDSIKYNGNEVTLNSKGEYTTPPFTENPVVSVVFGEINEGTGPEIQSVHFPFTYNRNDEVLTAVLFGEVLLKGTVASEYGVLYSYENNDFLLSDVDGDKVKKLQGKGMNSEGQFGVQIIDKTKDAPEISYAKTYAVINGNAVYGDLMSFSRKPSAADADIKTFSYDNAYIYPQFSPDVCDYILGIKEDNYNGFNYTVAEGATAEITYAQGIGETAKITVTSYNGIKKTYNFTYINSAESNSSGRTNTDGATYVMASDPDSDFIEGGDNSTSIYTFQYRSKHTSNRYAFYRFSLTDVNPFAGKVILSIGSNWSESSIATHAEGYKLAVYDTIYDKETAPDIYNLTYNNSLISGAYKGGEKIGILDVSKRETIYDTNGNRKGIALKLDITEFIKKKLVTGKKEFIIVLAADPTNDAWVTDAIGREYNNITLAQPKVIYDLKPNISWGE